MGKVKHSNWSYMGKCLSDYTKSQLVAILENVMSNAQTVKQDMRDAQDRATDLEFEMAKMKARKWWQLWAR